MKPLLTILMLVIVIGVKGQSRPMINWPADTGQIISASPGIYVLYQPRTDTVSCWFKMLIIDSARAYNTLVTKDISGNPLMLKNNIQEVWQEGYKIQHTRMANIYDGVPSERFEYLYSDRKTPVKNKVILSIER